LQPKERPASRLAFEALSARIIEDFHREQRIPYFEPVADTPGLARAVTSTLNELRLNQVDSEEIGRTGAPGADLARILTRFEEDAGSLLDLADVLDRALHNRNHPLLGLPVLWLCCEIPSLRHGLLAKHVLSQAPDVLALAPTGDLPNLQSLEAILGVEPEFLTLDTPMERVANSLFAPEVQATPGNFIRFFSAAGEGLECVEIARSIRLLADDGVPFDQVAVLLRSPERYQTLMEEALRRAGIAAHFTRGVARPDPAGRAFLALLACAAEGCSATRFAEYLSLGQTPARGEERRRDVLTPDDELLASFASAAGTAVALEPTEDQQSASFLASPFAWERMIVDAAVVGGRSRWERRLKGLEAELRFRLATLQRDDSARAPHVERQIEQLRSLSTFALPLIQQLGALPQNARWGEWLDDLQSLAAAALKRPDSVISALEELRAMEEVGPVDLAEVYAVLSDRMRFLRREPSTNRYGKVFVASIAEARGRCFRAVFLPGLAEGLFPRRAIEDPILLDTYRDQLQNPLVNQAERVRQERMLLHLAIGSADEKLYYSYPRMDVMQNRPRVPSFYALELLRATRGRLPELRKFEHEAASNAPTRLDWPAPFDTSEAIDNAEFDLAMLKKSGKGGGRYLMGANPHLIRSLRSRAGRWRQKWFPADGFVDADSRSLQALSKHRLNARAYSPSSLQAYASCPYKFLLHAVHRLEPREVPEGIEQLDPLTRGQIFHDVQFRLMQQLSELKALPVTRENRVIALEVADAVLNEVALRYADDLAPAIPRVWTNEIEDLRTDLRAWLIDVSERSTDWIPVNFELSFGLPIEEGSHDASSQLKPVAIPGHGYLLRGSIDLVERHATSGLLRITDHKTGSFPQKPPVHTGGGSVLQPVLYSIAATELMPGSQVQSGRLYFCTRKGDYKDVQIRYTPEAKDALLSVLETVDEAVATGFLPAYPKADACEYCDYRIVCGPYEAERTARKRKDRVVALTQLREQP
jgi:ATP-dependent helicase/nuclease subunit B